MANALSKLKMSSVEFLLWEREQVERYDFVDGQAYCMSGGTLEHGEGIGATYVTLKAHIKGTPCSVFMTDVQVRVEQLGNYFYPDISVTCSPADLADPQATYIAQPSLIIEVLSPSTAAYDRGDKFASLRQLASLKEYALLDISAQRLEVFRRNVQGRWELFETLGSTSAVQLQSIEWSGTLEQLLA